MFNETPAISACFLCTTALSVETNFAPIQLYNKLISIQVRSINEHIINERETLPTTQGQVLLGTGDILGQYVRRLADYGSEHNSSITTTSNGIYGVSSRYKIIWKVSLQNNNAGGAFTGSTNLSSNKMISSVVNKYLSILPTIEDNPLDYMNSGAGLISGYDNKYKEVLFTLMLRIQFSHTQIVRPPSQYTHTLNATLPNQRITNMQTYFEIGDRFYIYYSEINDGGEMKACNLITVSEVTSTSLKFNSDYPIGSISNVILLYSRTIVFNELLDMFIGEYTISPFMYFVLNNDMYSMPVSIPYDIDKTIYKHNAVKYDSENKTNYSTFYGELYPYKLSFIVNGAKEDMNSNMFTKLYNNLEIESDNSRFDKIEYFTKNQYSLHDWKVLYERPWIDPEYIEDSWKVPVSSQTSITKEGFEVDSNMRGKWLKVIITGTKTTAIFIKNIISNFVLSKS